MDRRVYGRLEGRFMAGDDLKRTLTVVMASCTKLLARLFQSLGIVLFVSDISHRPSCALA